MTTAARWYATSEKKVLVCFRADLESTSMPHRLMSSHFEHWLYILQILITVENI